VSEFNGQDTNREQSLIATGPETTGVYNGYSYYITLCWARVTWLSALTPGLTSSNYEVVLISLSFWWHSGACKCSMFCVEHRQDEVKQAGLCIGVKIIWLRC